MNSVLKIVVVGGLIAFMVAVQIKGYMDGQEAFMSGKYQVDGDLMLLMLLKSFFSRNSIIP